MTAAPVERQKALPADPAAHDPDSEFAGLTPARAECAAQGQPVA